MAARAALPPESERDATLGGATPTGVPQESNTESKTESNSASTSARGVSLFRPEAIAPGMRVRISPLELEGIVRAVHERTAEVEVNGKRLRAPFSELRIMESRAPHSRDAKGDSATGDNQREARADRKPDASARVTVHVQLSAREGSLTDLNVIGCTVSEALERADKFLDQALLAELRQVRVIHGHGTGQLRRALTDFLQDHPLVSRTMPAPPDQGGGGVTLVELRE
jgi:DNA mismatch repair protein MutS2